jgi:hypothetical protein
MSNTAHFWPAVVGFCGFGDFKTVLDSQQFDRLQDPGLPLCHPRTIGVETDWST